MTIKVTKPAINLREKLNELNSSEADKAIKDGVLTVKSAKVYGEVESDTLNVKGNVTFTDDTGLTDKVTWDSVAEELTIDGKVLVRKDGTSVGTIGVINANNLTVGGTVASHAGIQFGTGNVTPMIAGAQSDGVANLGTSTSRWNILYLSDGVVFDTVGGNATSNKLDAYEEGTWTPVYSGGTITTHSRSWGRYTKIGNIVHLSFYTRCQSTLSSSDVITITGVPFTFLSQGGDTDRIPVTIETNNFLNRPQAATITQATTTIDLWGTPIASKSITDALVETDMHVSNGYNLIYGTVTFRIN
jgi:hypothetical protein